MLKVMAQNQNVDNCFKLSENSNFYMYHDLIGLIEQFFLHGMSNMVNIK